MAVLSKIIIKQTRSECLCKKIPITSDNTLSKQEYKASFIIVISYFFNYPSYYIFFIFIK